jgi:toxin secretion/phage lysis holin
VETLFKIVVALSGASITYLWGEWSALLGVLVFIVAMDYITGVMASYHEGKLSSKIGLKGISKKVFIFAMVAIAYAIDKVMGDGTLIRDAAIFFYLANELLSIVENAGRVGLPVPPAIKKSIEVLKNKGGKDETLLPK